MESSPRNVALVALPLVAEALKAAQQAADVMVMDAESYDRAAAVRAALSAGQKAAEKYKTDGRKPYKADLDAFDQSCTAIIAELKTAKEAVDEAMKAWHEAERTLHATLMGEAADMGLAIAPPAKSVVTDVGGRMVRTTVTARWAYEVLDADAVPREFCAPDPGKINAAVAAGARSIPGVRIYLRDSVSQSPA